MTNAIVRLPSDTDQAALPAVLRQTFGLDALPQLYAVKGQNDKHRLFGVGQRCIFVRREKTHLAAWMLSDVALPADAASWTPGFIADLNRMRRVEA